MNCIPSTHLFSIFAYVGVILVFPSLLSKVQPHFCTHSSQHALHPSYDATVGYSNTTTYKVCILWCMMHHSFFHFMLSEFNHILLALALANTSFISHRRSYFNTIQQSQCISYFSGIIKSLPITLATMTTFWIYLFTVAFDYLVTSVVSAFGVAKFL